MYDEGTEKQHEVAFYRQQKSCTKCSNQGGSRYHQPTKAAKLAEPKTTKQLRSKASLCFVRCFDQHVDAHFKVLLQRKDPFRNVPRNPCSDSKVLPAQVCTVHTEGVCTDMAEAHYR